MTATEFASALLFALVDVRPPVANVAIAIGNEQAATAMALARRGKIDGFIVVLADEDDIATLVDVFTRDDAPAGLVATLRAVVADAAAMTNLDTMSLPRSEMPS